MSSFHMFASALSKESLAITYPSAVCWLVGVQKRPKVPNVSKSIIKKYPSFIRHSFVEFYVLKYVFPGRCGWP